jgi:release factor glutamine methyltransferase
VHDEVLPVAELTALLAQAGFVAALDEAEELLRHAAGDVGRLETSVARRLSGEPLAWITGRADFCGLEVLVEPGVYVPRWQSEELARRAVDHLPADGVAIDLCTGSGAIAMVMMAARPDARVVASDVDERSVQCALGNGVEAYCGDLFDPLPDLRGTLRSAAGEVDVVVAVVPYVPTHALTLLPRDTMTFESPVSYDGGADGTDVLRRVIVESPRVLRPGGALILELGGEQADTLMSDLAGNGFEDVEVLRDEDGDIRGIDAMLDG